MSCGGGHNDLSATVNYDFFLDRTPVCNPRFTHLEPEEETADCAIQMEHSYSRDKRPTDKTMATRTILVHKPPPCPSCHSSASAPHDHDTVEMDEESLPVLPLPEIDESAAREAMDVIGNIASKTKNRNSEDDDWEEVVDKTGWTIYQQTLFAKVAEILALDRLARLTQCNHPSEPILRRANIDKAVARMRKALAIIHWDTKLSQWLHGLLIDHLPPSFMAPYMDILQTLRCKVPTLVDKMVQGRSNELLEAVMKPPWEPVTEPKDRKLTTEPIILICPSTLIPNQNSSREKNWTALFSTLSSSIRTVNIPDQFFPDNMPITESVETLVTLTRTRLHEVRKESPQKKVILAGFNAGSALALQVASLEPNLSCVICMGFATNTLRGARGHLDDRLVELSTPVLFVIGQNAMRTSQEQIEALREQMVAPTALVVVGSADDCLHVNHAKRKLEHVTQSMVDNMVMDEVAEFAKNCIANPPPAIKRRPPVVQPTPGVVLNTPAKLGEVKKTPVFNGVTALLQRKPKTPLTQFNNGPVSLGRVTKKKDLVDVKRSGVAKKLSPTKKEYAEKLGITAHPGSTSYEIVTGKFKHDIGVRKIMDGGFVKIANEGASVAPKWQISRSAAGAKVMLPVIQKQKISLGSQFTPMRTKRPLMNGNSATRGTISTKEVYSVDGSVKKIFSIKAPPAPITTTEVETIELDTDEEIINLNGGTILNAQMVDAATVDSQMELSAGDLSDIPVVFQDCDGNIQEPITEQSSSIVISEVPQAATTMTGSVVVTNQTVIPRPNKFIYYKPQQGQKTFTKSSPQYVLLSNSDDNRTTSRASPTTAAIVQQNCSKPLIISVESVDKDEPNIVYHVVSDDE